jgi:hypothetical protein
MSRSKTGFFVAVPPPTHPFKRRRGYPEYGPIHRNVAGDRKRKHVAYAYAGGPAHHSEHKHHGEDRSQTGRNAQQSIVICLDGTSNTPDQTEMGFAAQTSAGQSPPKKRLRLHTRRRQSILYRTNLRTA